MIGVHFSSQRQNWRTPKKFYEELDKEFHFDHDPCPANPTVNGLATKWGKMNFVNPPYSDIKDWVEKAYSESLQNRASVMLIPSRTDTRWWHDFVMLADEIRFIKGRLKFDEHKNPAPFPSCLVIFNGKPYQSLSSFPEGVRVIPCGTTMKERLQGGGKDDRK